MKRHSGIMALIDQFEGLDTYENDDTEQGEGHFQWDILKFEELLDIIGYSTNTDERCLALKYLGEVKTTIVLDMIRNLVYEKNDEIPEKLKITAVAVLEKLGAVEELIDLLEYSQGSVKLKIIETFGRIKDERIILPLSNVIFGEEGECRDKALACLIKRRREAILVHSQRVISDENDEDEIEASARLLILLNAKEAFVPLVKKLTKGGFADEFGYDSAVLEAVIAFSPRKITDLIEEWGSNYPEALFSIADDYDGNYDYCLKNRLGAIWLLGKSEDPKYIKSLLQALDDPDKRIVKEARAALILIGDACS